MNAIFFATGLATQCDRSPAEAAVDPSSATWLYRSEAFAEDLSELVPAAACGPAAAPHGPRPARAVALWPATLAAAWFTRVQGAR
jgi:hypothetical protein